MSLLHMLPACILFALSPTFFLLWIFLFLLSKFSMKWYIYLDEKIYSIYQRSVVLFYEQFMGTEVLFYGDHEKVFKKKENVLYICNHQSTVDWVMSDIIIARQGGIGRLRYILKDELKYIPLYGFYFFMHGCIYVNRKQFEKDKAIKSMKYLTDNNISSWLVVFPEGTRFDKNKRKVIERSRKFAEEQGLIPLEYHLTPRMKGLELVLENLGDKLDAFYNITILFEDKSNYDKGKSWKRSLPGMFEWYRTTRVIHINIERLSLSEIPRSGEPLRNWLHNIFLEKDELMRKILTNEISSTDSKWPLKNVYRKNIRLLETLPCFLFLLGVSTLFMFTYWGRVLYLGITIGCGIFGIVYAFLYI